MITSNIPQNIDRSKLLNEWNERVRNKQTSEIVSEMESLDKELGLPRAIIECVVKEEGERGGKLE